MEPTLNCEGKDYLSNSAKVIVSSKWKSCSKKLRRLSEVQGNSDGQDFSELTSLYGLPTHCLHATLSSSFKFPRDSGGFLKEKNGNIASCRCCPCNANEMGVALVAIS